MNEEQDLLIQERDRLKSQNEQLWQIVNKQKELIRQLKLQQQIGDTTLIKNVDDSELLIADLRRNHDENEKNDKSIISDLPISTTRNRSSSLAQSARITSMEPVSSVGDRNDSTGEKSREPSMVGKTRDSRVQAAPDSNSNIEVIEPLFVKSVKRKINNDILFLYIFQLWIPGQNLRFIEKSQSDFTKFFVSLKPSYPDIPELPEAKLFSIGATGNILQGWLKRVFSQCNTSEVKEFTESSIINQSQLKESFKMNGLLYKKGNYFGGWKTRYYELDTSSGNIFYSETNKVEVLGIISLKFAYAGIYIPDKIVKKDGDITDMPGFVVLEYKKSFFSTTPALEQTNSDGLPNGKVEFRHVFHAETVEERDHWVRCISGVIARFRPEDRVAQYYFTLTVPPDPKLRLNNPNRKDSNQNKPSAVNIADSSTIEKDAAESKLEDVSSTATSPVETGQKSVTQKQGVPQLPGAVDDQSRCMAQAMPPPLSEEIPLKYPGKSNPDITKKKTNFFKGLMHRERSEANSKKFNIFGMSLQEATDATRIAPGIEIPALIYRCIEFIDHKNNFLEEGIFRLSGATSMINTLKTRFEEDGDFSLVDADDYYDPHAVAGLLKLFFRELAEPLCTQLLRPQLFKITENTDRDIRILSLKNLVAKLPKVNYTCLRILCANLLKVVKHNDKNKMTVRNIAIVFSPTLGIPAGLFTILLAEYSSIFPWGINDDSRMIHVDHETTKSPEKNEKESTSSIIITEKKDSTLTNQIGSAKYLMLISTEMMQVLENQLKEIDYNEINENIHDPQVVDDLLK